MDELDFRILGHLFQHPMDGPQAIAHAVGRTRNSIARRIRILEDSPVALTFFALPHQDLFGLQSTVNLYIVDSPDLDGLWDCGPVLGYDLNHDGLLAITTWTPDGKPPKELDTQLGGAPIAQYADTTPGPRVAHLSRLEWKVAHAMMHGPRASAADLARHSGLAPRTCAKTRSRLIDDGAIRLGVTVSEDHSEGYPIFRLYVQGEFSRSAIRDMLGPDTVVSDTVEEGCVYFAHAKSLGSIMATAERIKHEPGVDDIKLILSRQADMNMDWLDELMQERINTV